MFSSISWHQFITALLIIAFLYYFFVIALYYRKDLVQLSKQGFPKKQSQPKLTETGNHSSSAGSNTISTKNENDPLLLSGVHELMEELKGMFIKASKDKSPKAELLMALAAKIRNYPQLKDSALEKAVMDHIAIESSRQCNIELTDMDLRQLW